MKQTETLKNFFSRKFSKTDIIGLIGLNAYVTISAMYLQGMGLARLSFVSNFGTAGIGTDQFFLKDLINIVIINELKRLNFSDELIREIICSDELNSYLDQPSQYHKNQASVFFWTELLADESCLEADSPGWYFYAIDTKKFEAHCFPSYKNVTSLYFLNITSIIEKIAEIFSE